MKKILSIVLALVMILSLSTVVFAAGVEAENSLKSEAVSAAITLDKVYDVIGSTDANLFPAETLKFTVVAGENNVDTEMITVDDLVVTGNDDQTIKINLPVYDTVGLYEYTITENAGTAQGVVYADAEISVKVLVTYNYEAGKLDTQIVLNTLVDGEKVDTFTNEYNVGHLTVQKTISGNLASDSQYFEMTVAFAAEGTVASDITVSGGSNGSNPTTIAKDWTGEKNVTIYLKADETLTFNNIPAGVTYTVTESAAHAAEDATGADASKGYTVEYTDETGAIEANETAAAVVNNDKGTTVETGIALDSMPYIMILAVVAGAFVLTSFKKREI